MHSSRQSNEKNSDSKVASDTGEVQRVWAKSARLYPDTDSVPGEILKNEGSKAVAGLADYILRELNKAPRQSINNLARLCIYEQRHKQLYDERLLEYFARLAENPHGINQLIKRINQRRAQKDGRQLKK